MSEDSTPIKGKPIEGTSNCNPIGGTPILATAGPSPVQAEPVLKVVHAQVFDANQLNNTGICRRCGREFTRPPDVHNADNRYYRCSQCSNVRVEDFCCVQ